MTTQKTMRRPQKKQAWQTQLAAERMEILFGQAEKEFKSGRPDLANRYVKIARAIGMKTNVSIPSHLKKRFCRKCLEYLVPGKNSRVRLSAEKHYVLITCLACGNRSRFPYKSSSK